MKQVPNWQNNTYEQVISTITDLPLVPAQPIEGPIMLYGAGELGFLAYEYCKSLGIKVEAIIDQNAERQKAKFDWQEQAIITPQDIDEHIKGHVTLLVCIATLPINDLNASLSELGWKHIYHFYQFSNQFTHLHPLNNGWVADAISKADEEKMQTVLANWHDELSKQHYIQFVAWRRLNIEICYEPTSIKQNNRFFIEQVIQTLPQDLRFADVGAHQGKITKQLFSIRNKNFTKLWLIEADKYNYTQLNEEQACFQQMSNNECELANMALSNQQGQYSFYPGLGYASRLTQIGKETVSTKTLDSLNITPNLIKLHVEGEELNVLKGGLKTILSNRPIICATVYHNDDALWRTPLWLKNNLPDYHFYIRLHSWVGTGAVIYAIPNELNQ